jgi:Uma2 family endonuclease
MTDGGGVHQAEQGGKESGAMNRASTTARRQKVPVTQLKGPLVLFRMTSDQFCELPESETVCLELLNGEVVIMPRPTSWHQYFILQLAMVIELWVRRRKLGRLLPDTLLKLDDEWTPAPDLVFVARRHLKRVKEKRIEGPVDLAIEALSPSHPELDRETKFAAYARFGIRWYWIVDLKARVLEEYELVGGSYGNLIKAPFDAPFAPRLFPGLMIDLASLEW